MKILVTGDIFGRPGRDAFCKLLPQIIAEHQVDFVISNIENASGGRGVNPKSLQQILSAPVDVMTSGNHIWEFNDIFPFLNDKPIVRPLNVDKRAPGKGWLVTAAKNGVKVGVLQLQGQGFMDGKGPTLLSPFECIDEHIIEIKRQADLIFVDVHAEATSEKRALSWYLDGKVTAVLGTHTHVQTADEHIMPAGTAYISDLGMTGPHDSVIGLDKDVALDRFINHKRKFKVAQTGVRLEGALIVAESKTGKAISIERISKTYNSDAAN